MPTGLSVALAMLAQTAPATADQAPPKSAERECSPRNPLGEHGEIIVCAIKPEGYRIDPDVLSAKKAKKKAMAGGPKPPENYKQNDCATIGPMGCRGGPAIDLLAATMTAAEIAARLAKGQEVGSLFVTTPEASEYDYYKQAKHEREAKRAAAEIKARVKARADAAAAVAADPSASTPR